MNFPMPWASFSQTSFSLFIRSNVCYSFSKQQHCRSSHRCHHPGQLFVSRKRLLTNMTRLIPPREASPDRAFSVKETLLRGGRNRILSVCKFNVGTLGKLWCCSGQQLVVDQNTRDGWRDWLNQHYKTSAGNGLGLYEKDTGVPTPLVYGRYIQFYLPTQITMR